MRELLTDAGHTLVPPKGDRDGPLPPLLLLLTVLTGVVDAVSYLALGHVFVANMTGNVVFLGFGLAGAAGLSALASTVAVASFLGGALTGGALAGRYGAHRGRLLGVATGVQTVLVAAATVVAVLPWAVVAGEVTVAAQYVLIVLLGVAMGLQNAVARRLAVPDLTTTVLTLTLTGLAADSGAAGGQAPRPGRRVLSVLAMFLGALIGAVLLAHTSLALTLGVSLVPLAVTAVAARRLSASKEPWTVPRG